MFGGGLFYFYRSNKKESSNEKLILFGFGNLWFWSGIGYLISYFNMYFTEGFYVGNTYYVEFGQHLSHVNFVLWIIIAIMEIIGYIIFTISFEIATRRTFFILPIYQIVISFLTMLFFPSLNTLFFMSNVLIIAFIFVWLSRKTRKELQGFSVAITIGLVIFYFGSSLNANIFYELQIFPTWFPTLFIISGALLTLLTTIITPERFTRPFLFWVFFSIVEIFAILAIFFILSFSSQFNLIVFISILSSLILNLLILGYVISRIVRILNPPVVLKTLTTKAEKDKDFITIFARPKKLTEDEVSISKEKKICLVCKTKLSKEIFLCSNCGTFYCIKCEQALSESENMYWVCSSPFDESKPSKSFEKSKEEEISISKEKKDK
jgi:hypothetical protein